ncbi:MAG: 30S ribosomal protein S13 [bacterium]|nr:30S ribosomal protein S13 [bacterium]|tara:strand:+ start:158 stop:529 length:372 start_codon:yes stop_codon:yes gene_type:complete
MARIAGVDLPRGKRIEYALTYIFGIGLTSSKQILDKLKIDYNTRVRDLADSEVSKIAKEIQESYKVEGDLRKERTMNIKRLMDIGCYRGLRHRRGLPCRGQRTRTNARTRKGPRRTVGARRKK